MTQKNGSVIVETNIVCLKPRQTLADRGYSQEIIDTAIELPRALKEHEIVVNGKIKKDQARSEEARINRMTPKEIINELLSHIARIEERLTKLEKGNKDA